MSLTEQVSPTRVFRAGRRNGAKNVNSLTVKRNVMAVFEGLGGWQAMLEWAKDNPNLFYGHVYPKLIPAEIAEAGLGTGHITVHIHADPKLPSSNPLVINGPEVEIPTGSDV